MVIAGATCLIGRIRIRIGSNTTLRIETDGILQGTPDRADYPVVQVRWKGRWIPG
ncbi:hypothetical protein [Brevundimonas sp. DC300-4]|uniref:hypothetical protein n=1 Tax=Brevundimonas sp. DC300-4 TaxID=2804594 RepID=UPI003CE6C03F